nr:hypothetical protein [uncultured Carboxylicivirga sp.]
MYSHIRNITREILHRKKMNWDKCICPTYHPPFEENFLLITMCDTMIDSFLNTMLEEDSHRKRIHRHIQFISQIKELLHAQWPELPYLNAHPKQWYIHDVLFFIKICHHLTETLCYCKNYINLKELPSEHFCCALSSTLPGYILEDPTLIKQYPELNLTTVAASKLINICKSIIDKTQGDPFLLTTSIKRLLKQGPTSLAHEQYCLNILNSHLITIDKYDCDIINDHQLLSTSLALSYTNIEETFSIINTYIKHTIKQPDTTIKLQTECVFWKLFLAHITTIIPSHFRHKKDITNRIKSIINMLNNNENHISPQAPIFEWHGSTGEFVRYFYDLISGRKLSSNKSYDMEPYVRQLHRTISIKKDKGQGYLSCNSLLTYFKQMNSEI